MPDSQVAAKHFESLGSATTPSKSCNSCFTTQRKCRLATENPSTKPLGNLKNLAQAEHSDLISPKPWTDQREEKENQI